MTDERPPLEKLPHGRLGPTTPAEESSRDADPAVVPPSEKARIAEAASREEDA